MQKLVLLLISAYRYLVSPFLTAHCRYYPTCSEYAQTAIERFGLIKGGWMSTKRICRCHPWHEGGVDPVPDAQSEHACSLHSTGTTGNNKHG